MNKLAKDLSARLGSADILAALDGMPVGAALLDPEGRALFLNRALETLTGFTRGEACGVPCRHILRSSVCVYKCPGLACRTSGPAEPFQSDLPAGASGVEGNIINRHRRKVPVRLTPVPIRDEAGTLLFILEVVEDLSQLKEMEERVQRVAGPGQIVGRSTQMENILRLLPVLAQSDSPVLVTGETGTGKDMIAEAIHRDSPRARDPFIRVSSSLMPEALLESELFGHRKGAYAWAEEDKPGKFQLANNGTLYLSEIGDLPHAIQAQLVRFLDERLIYPVGSDQGVKVNVRLVAATHRSPEEMVRSGALRQDLFHRLNAVRLHLPPLRERGEDLQFLLNHFLRLIAAKLKKDIKGFSPKAMRILLDYPYPGNVREMRNIVEYAVMVCQRDIILPAHLPVHLLMSRPLEKKNNGRAASAKR